jgi:hypothetical protein
MHLLPLALGIIAISIGIAMVAFGIPINEFGTGNTLIAAGTTAIVGGFVLLGLWAAVLQLQRLLAALEPRSTRAALGRGASAAPDPERARRQVQAESAGLASALRGPRLAPEEEHEPPASAPEAERPAERPTWLPPEEEPEPRLRERASGHERPAPRAEESSWELFAPTRASGAGPERSFDSIWPSERPARESPHEAAQSGDRGRAEERNPEQAPRSAAEAQPATILKSGVINGMAYTLYTDGSIEAELPQGTLRFRSLDELRDYLAGNP